MTHALTTRRQLLKSSTAAMAALAAPALVHSQASAKIRIGFWPVAAGLPFFTALERGFFRQAGLDVEVQKFSSAQQVTEAILSGRSDGSANGVGAANLAIGEIAQPGLFKIFCTNPSNAQHVLDEFIIAKHSPITRVAELSKQKVGCGPGIQNVTLAKTMLERAGATGAQVVELPLGQHVAAIAAGQIEACYTLEPTGTVGRLNGTTRVLEAGVVSHYVLGDPLALWHGGAASLGSDFLRHQPQLAVRYMAAYRQGVQFVRDQPDQARQYLRHYTAVDGKLSNEVPLASYRFHDEFKASDTAYLQKFYDLFTEKNIFSRRVDAAALLYRAQA